jgi:hypothetical protein
MARELVVKDWCDVCLTDDDRRTEGQPFVYGSSPAAVVEVVLCSQHAGQVTVTDLPGIADKYGTKPDQPDGRQKPPKAVQAGSNWQDKFPCPVCGTSYNRFYMSSHLRRTHETSLTDIAGIKKGRDGKLICPDCGQKTATPQGMGAHRASHRRATTTN